MSNQAPGRTSTAPAGPPGRTGTAPAGRPGAPVPPPAGAAPGPVRRPWQLGAAVAALPVRVGLGLVVAASQLSDGDALRAEIAAANAPLTAAEVSSVYLAVVGVSVVVGLCYAALYALLAVRLRAGRNWARNIARGLAGLSALALLGSLGDPDPPVDAPLGVAVLLVDALILALLSVPPVRRYVAARAAAGG